MAVELKFSKMLASLIIATHFGPDVGDLALGEDGPFKKISPESVVDVFENDREIDGAPYWSLALFFFVKLWRQAAKDVDFSLNNLFWKSLVKSFADCSPFELQSRVRR